MHLRSSFCAFALLVGLASVSPLLYAQAGATPAQPQGATPAQPQGATPAQPQGATPAQPQGATPAQPQGATPAQAQGMRSSLPLTVDRDPVPSPDPDSATPASTAGTTQPANGEIARGANGRYTLKRDAYEVRLDASVFDGSGRNIQSLPEDAFHIYEDGVPQKIADFRHQDLPVSIGLLIDNSGSMYDKRASVDKASVDLIRLSNPQDEEFLVDFSSEPFIDQDFTSSIDKLEQGLGLANSAGGKGGTAIYDAVSASADYLQKNAKNPKQVLIIITDGEDNASGSTLEQTIRRIQDLDGPVVYCVGLLFGEDTDRREARNAQRVLSAISQQTGGQAYFPRSLKEVDGIAATVAADIRSQYTIAYRSSNPPQNGGYRQVHVTAQSKGFGKLDVRTRSGYYPRTSVPASAGGTQ